MPTRAAATDSTSCLLRCGVVWGETRKARRIWPAAAALLVLCSLVPARVAADSSAPKLRARADELTQQNANLAARAHSALLELYALDSRLARQRAHIVALRIETAQVRAARQAAQRRLDIAHRSLSSAQHMLAVRLQQLYEQGDSD